MAVSHEPRTILDSIGEALDIPPSVYKVAVDRYQAVGKWLDASGSPLKQYLPKVYPQGSFRLGTVVRPFSKGDEREYDIDLVCQLDIDRSNVQPGQVKRAVGDRLREHAKYREMLAEEGRRCWTLEYAEDDGVAFHLDALPSVNESQTIKKTLISFGVSPDWANRAIAATNREDQAYTWTECNPDGYAQWFESRNAAAFARSLEIQKRALYERNKVLYASVAEVPDQLARTPLQRLIQILKRHRDVRFDGKPFAEYAPISIIVTTLATWAYEGQDDLETTLRSFIYIVKNSPERILLLKDKNGEWQIPNPVNPRENFAEKWNDDGGKRANYFFEWIEWLQEDVAAIAGSIKLAASAAEEGARKLFGVRLATRDSAASFAGNSTSKLVVLTSSASFFDQPHREAPHWPMQRTGNAYISCDMSGKGFRPRKLASNDPILAKHLSLEFAATTDVTGSFDVYWQVVNTGEEARRAGGLRGQFFWENASRHESTLYKGRHWIQCFIVKNGICVASSKEFIINIE